MPRLCLTRRVGQSITFQVAGHVVSVKLDELHPGRAIISIVAPAEVQILRSEILQRHDITQPGETLDRMHTT